MDGDTSTASAWRPSSNAGLTKHELQIEFGDYFFISEITLHSGGGRKPVGSRRGQIVPMQPDVARASCTEEIEERFLSCQKYLHAARPFKTSRCAIGVRRTLNGFLLSRPSLETRRSSTQFSSWRLPRQTCLSWWTRQAISLYPKLSSQEHAAPVRTTPKAAKQPPILHSGGISDSAHNEGLHSLGRATECSLWQCFADTSATHRVEGHGPGGTTARFGRHRVVLGPSMMMIDRLTKHSLLLPPRKLLVRMKMGDRLLGYRSP